MQGQKVLIALIIIVVIIGGGYLLFGRETDDMPEPIEMEKADVIRVTTPRPNDLITSPFEVEGEARGVWFFEASFPVRLYDGEGNEVTVAIAQAQDDWMTENFVPFRATLEFISPGSQKGMLVFEKDNPSGLAEHSDELRIPVRFE